MSNVDDVELIDCILVPEETPANEEIGLEMFVIMHSFYRRAAGSVVNEA